MPQGSQAAILGQKPSQNSSPLHDAPTRVATIRASNGHLQPTFKLQQLKAILLAFSAPHPVVPTRTSLPRDVAR